jgi:hypothetical protein
VSEVGSSSGGRSPITWPLAAAVVVVAPAAGAGCGVLCPLCPPVDLWAVGLDLGLELELEFFLLKRGGRLAVVVAVVVGCCVVLRVLTPAVPLWLCSLLAPTPMPDARCPPVRGPGPGPGPVPRTPAKDNESEGQRERMRCALPDLLPTRCTLGHVALLLLPKKLCRGSPSPENFFAICSLFVLMR